MEDSRLVGKVTEDNQPSKKKIRAVDTLGNITYSLIVGSALDYATGLNLKGILASRAYATGVNSVTGGPYGWWREKIYRITRTKETSSKFKKGLSNLLAFNTFQVPIYGSAVAIASFFSEGEIDFEKVENGMINLAIVSPLIGPTMNWTMDKFRKLFGIRTAIKGAYKINE